MHWTAHKFIHWVLVLSTFACTGTVTAKLGTWLALELGFEKYHLVWWLLLIALLPVYSVLLLGFAFIFGKFSFFKEKQRKMWSRILKRRVKIKRAEGKEVEERRSKK